MAIPRSDDQYFPRGMRRVAFDWVFLGLVKVLQYQEGVLAKEDHLPYM
jgi:hypothetical protein